MKKRWILLILPLMMMVMPVASANGWGLPEALVPLVSNTNDYDDYYHLADDYARKENSARIIMQSRYHNQLVAVDEVKDGWKDAIFSTTAVYQPSELDETGYPKITRTKSGFELAYPDIDERFYFELQHNNEGGAVYTLTEAQMGGVTVERQAEYFYLVTLGDDNAVWAVEVTLENFNIHNMPKRGPDDVRRINEANKGLQYLAYLYPHRTRPLTARRREKRPSARATIISCTSPWATGR